MHWLFEVVLIWMVIDRSRRSNWNEGPLLLHWSEAAVLGNL